MSEEQKPKTGAETPEAPETPGTPVSKEMRKLNLPKTPEDKKKVKWLGWALILIPLIIIFSLVVFWPNMEPLNKASDPISKNTVITSPGTPADSPKEGSADNSKPSAVWSKQTNIIKFNISFQLRMLILVLLGGALGSYIHMATSFSTYLGLRLFEMDWFWWYFLRIPIGAVLALIFSILIQGGMLAVPAGSADGKHVAIIGLAALIGMFSRQATEKLQDVFDTVFNSTQGKKNKETQDEITAATKKDGNADTNAGKNGKG